MKAIYYDQFLSQPIVADIPLPNIDSNSVLLKVEAAGICRSDWHGWQGHDPDISLPHVPGHEFAGIVEQVGARVKNWHVGDPATTPFVQACGHCHYCGRGDHQVCENQEQAGFTHFGAFAEFVEVKYADVNLVGIPAALSFEEAAVMGCRFGTAFRAVVDQAQVKNDDWVVIFGCGGVGLSTLMICHAFGAKTLVVDPNAEARDLAVKFGATLTLPALTDATTQSFLEEVEPVQVSFDAIGHPQVVVDAMRILARRGKHIQVGLMGNGGEWKLDANRLVALELELLGSHGIQSHRYVDMLKFVMDAKIRILPLIKDRCNLKEGIEKLISMGENKHHGIDVITDFSS